MKLKPKHIYSILGGAVVVAAAAGSLITYAVTHNAPPELPAGNPDLSSAVTNILTTAAETKGQQPVDTTPAPTAAQTKKPSEKIAPTATSAPTKKTSEVKPVDIATEPNATTPALTTAPKKVDFSLKNKLVLSKTNIKIRAVKVQVRYDYEDILIVLSVDSFGDKIFDPTGSVDTTVKDKNGKSLSLFSSHGSGNIVRDFLTNPDGTTLPFQMLPDKVLSAENIEWLICLPYTDLSDLSHVTITATFYGQEPITFELDLPV
jgi:hypothetical protein